MQIAADDGFETHSHGRRKNKGRQPGGGEPRGGGAGGAGGPGSGRVDRSQIHETAGGGAFSVTHGDQQIGVTAGPGVKLNRDQAAEYMDGIAAGVDAAPLKSGRPIEVHVSSPPGTMAASTRSWVHPTEVSRAGDTEPIRIGVNHTAGGGAGIQPAGVPASTVAATAGYGRVQSYESGFAFTGPPGRAPRGADSISTYASTNNASLHSEAFVAHVYGTGSAANPGRASKLVSDIAKTEGWGPSALTASAGTDEFAAGEDTPSGAIVAFLPADPESLTVDGGDPPDQLHVTCCYLTADAASLDEAELAGLDEALTELATVGPPIVCDVAAVATFRPGEDGLSATALVLESEDLSYAHEMIDDVTEPYTDGEDQYPQWIPHLTLGYGLDPGVGLELMNSQIVLDRLALIVAGDITEYPLTGGGPGQDVIQSPDQPERPPVDQQPPAEPVPAAAATVPAFRLIEGEGGPASDTPAMAITRHPAAGFYAGPAPLHAVKEN